MNTEQKERCEKLIAALRDPSTWPAGFVWDFADGHRCGIGLARKAEIVPASEFSVSVSLGLTTQQAEDAFRFCPSTLNFKKTPTEVADILERAVRSNP